MTVGELRKKIKHYDDKDSVPLSWVIAELSYVVAALEQWREIGDLFGRNFHPEVEQFLNDAYESL